MAARPLTRFLGAVAYCVAYDRWGPQAAGELLARLREGKELEKEEEKGLVKAIDLALTAPGGSETERLTQVKKEAEEVGCPTVGLVMGGATKIKQYVFESAKLPEIRGASGLLDRINRFDLPALFRRPSEASEKGTGKLHAEGGLRARGRRGAFVGRRYVIGSGKSSGE